ncbi:rhodanese-like domain-containing protein 4A, chloroplastic [Cucurbita moschata]|uniref:Rhodanese-like domain-containing protein 4A, chloroplastic n=1 Tax=Cucurbita moschata TaxID=3662 RepID=A0A6J1GPW4_CUCMO|nr:rhodanese-like domain-containing protein 4A, chloroplastic [Cucurbita moschata]
MESHSLYLSSSSLFLHKLPSHKPISLSPSLIPFNSKPLSVFNGAHLPTINKTPFQNPTNPSKPLRNPHFLFAKTSPFHQLVKSHLPFALTQLLLSPLPSLALETDQASSDKINLESILVSIDDFFNRYPFFVAGCTFIWLVGIPLIDYYFLRKYKFISAIDAFRRIRDDPNAQLLDIRDEKSLAFLGSPNLRILNKDVVQVVYSEEDEDGFVKKVKKGFGDGADTLVFVLDNFDGNSMKVAELLFKNGFKEAYAIKDGVRGEKGWMAIQESLLPPSVHISRRKKAKASKKFGTNGVVQKSVDKEAVPSLNSSNGEIQTSPLHVNASSDTESKLKTRSRSSSPYPNYPDLKPPSSPTPSKPRT